MVAALHLAILALVARKKRERRTQLEQGFHPLQLASSAEDFLFTCCDRLRGAANPDMHPRPAAVFTPGCRSRSAVAWARRRTSRRDCPKHWQTAPRDPDVHLTRASSVVDDLPTLNHRHCLSAFLPWHRFLFVSRQERQDRQVKMLRPARGIRTQVILALLAFLARET